MRLSCFVISSAVAERVLTTRRRRSDVVASFLQLPSSIVHGLILPEFSIQLLSLIHIKPGCLSGSTDRVRGLELWIPWRVVYLVSFVYSDTLPASCPGEHHSTVLFSTTAAAALLPSQTLANSFSSESHFMSDGCHDTDLHPFRCARLDAEVRATSPKPTFWSGYCRAECSGSSLCTERQEGGGD